MDASIHEHCELESYSISDIEPVELSMQSRQTAVELSSVAITTQAAEFITLCNLSVMTLGDSASTAL